jgi:hypothetical protein
MSDDVSQFLQQVEQLKDRRIEEDEARSRELEEKILQERKERQARRAGMFILYTPPFHAQGAG